jgi:cytochrome oxidase Cu insertion factor (SCO1/SenC/PrrC family)
MEKMRNSKFEIRSTLLPLHWNNLMIELRLPRFTRNDLTFQKSKIQNPKSKIKSHAVSIYLAIKDYFPLTKIQNPKSKIQNFIFILHTLYFLLLTSPLKAQITADSTNLISSFQVNAKYIQADELSNLYIVNQSNQLYKYNSEGKILATLNYNYNGNISSIDATNPMEIYVFYKELNRVIFLDNNLAYRGEIDLSKNNITQASAIARSYDNGIWVFDNGDLQLKKLDKEGKVFQSSANIKQFTNVDFNPKYIIENTQNVIISDDSICLVFDVFASFVKTYYFKNLKSIQFTNHFLYETQDSLVNILDFRLGLKRVFILNKTALNFKWSYVYENKFFIYKNNTISLHNK